MSEIKKISDKLIEVKGDLNHMISDEQLDAYRISGERVRVVRDALESNDVKGIVLAWDDTQVMVRRPNKRVVKLDRNYVYQPFSEPRRQPDNI